GVESVDIPTSKPAHLSRLARLLAILAVLALIAVPGAAAGRAPDAPPDPPPHDAAALLAETPNWQGQYFANPNLSGTPALTRADPAINFYWGAGSPDPAIPVDGFSVRWSRKLNLAAGTYRFATITDDG